MNRITIIPKKEFIMVKDNSYGIRGTWTFPKMKLTKRNIWMIIEEVLNVKAMVKLKLN